MSNNTTERAICPECGATIRIKRSMEYSYCPDCTSRFLFRDAIRGNISKGLINALSGKELDALIKQATDPEIDRLELASEKGSGIAALKAGEYYLQKDNHREAKTHFDLAASRNVPEAKYCSLICSLETDDKADFKQVLKEIQSFPSSSVKNLSTGTLNKLNNIVEEKQSIYELAESLAELLTLVSKNNSRERDNTYRTHYTDDVLSSGCSYNDYFDDYIDSSFSDGIIHMGGETFDVYMHDAEGYGSRPYIQDAEGYKTYVDPDSVEDPFNWIDAGE